MNEREIFIGALQEESLAAQQAFLDNACGSDAELRRRVEGLLRDREKAADFLHSPAPWLVATADDAIRERPGTVIGPYKLLEQIGEGGFGVVFMAEQQKPIRRKVALKILKPGMDTRQVVARFAAERQVLALMDHPNIARVLDAGQTSSGRPYFVMDLVKGLPITDYCDQSQLTPRERLELFVDVCQAVQHAHQKGIIHRDIKPSNVLVTVQDGTPLVKVIDFGIAKALGQQLTDKTLFTGFAQLIGTPLYMSPEQAALSNIDVDTRSDVYSLGVLLYELLTGTTPFDRERLKEVEYDEMRRIIREEEPPKPSTRISTLGPAAVTVSTQRRGDPRRLSQLFRGELDWMVMRALEKDRNRRYETASAFATDVQHYLHDEPVQACPPSASYRLGKFVRRHRGPVWASAVVLLALVGGMVGTAWGLLRAELAWQAEADRAEAERQAKETAQAVLDFVENRVFAAAQPEKYAGGLGREVTLRRAVEAALPFVEQGFPEQPLIEARLRQTLGLSFLYLGEGQIAAEQFQRARTLYSQHRGPDHPLTLTSMMNLANSYGALGGRHADAAKLHEETLALKKAKLSPDHPDTLASMHNLANSYRALGRHAEAIQLREGTLALRKAKLGPAHPDTLMSMNNLAESLATASDAKLRDPMRALRLAQAVVQHMPKNGGYWNTLGVAYYRAGDWSQAIAALEKSETLKPGQLVADNGFFLAMAHWQRGNQADARKWYERAVGWMEKNNPKDAELRRLREEATKLLGVSESQAEKKKP